MTCLQGVVILLGLRIACVFDQIDPLRAISTSFATNRIQLKNRRFYDSTSGGKEEEYSVGDGSNERAHGCVSVRVFK